MSATKSNSDRFISAYNQLDKYMERNLGGDRGNTTYYHRVNAMASRNATFRKRKELLHSFGELRNAIVHDFGRNSIEIIAEPHLAHVEVFEKILHEVMDPPNALEKLAVKRQDIFALKPEDLALTAIQKMTRENYSYLPLLSNDQLVGVFSEESVFAYLSEHGSMDLSKGLKIKDFQAYTKLDAHRNEAFQFASRLETVADLEERLRSVKEGDKRLEVIFITERGKSSEKLLGMVTIWDLARDMV